jgi:hypothetical protein
VNHEGRAQDHCAANNTKQRIHLFIKLQMCETSDINWIEK